MYCKDRGKKGLEIVLVRREKPWQQRRLQFCTVPSSTRRSEEMQLM